MLRLKKVGVLMGGLSAEREISVRSGEAVFSALKERGYQVKRLFVDRDIDMVLRQSEVDLVFNALHGRYGEDGCIQGMLELMGIPYTGSGVLASSLAMHKVKAKELFRLHNLPTPPYYVLDREAFVDLEEAHGAFGYPVIVKPACEGSSVGISVARNLDELEAACQEAFKFDEELLVERYIKGRNVQVGILANQPLGAVEVETDRAFFDYQSKYSEGHAEFHLPPRISQERLRGALTQAQRAHQAIGCTGATRVNMIISDLGNEYLLEVNTLPGLTQQSLLPRIAEAAGMPFGDLVEAIMLDAGLRAGGTVQVGERRIHQLPFPGPNRRAGVAIN